VVVGGDEAWPPPWVTRLALELVVLPHGVRRAGVGASCALQDDLRALLGDAPEGAVCVDDPERVEGGVHDLRGAQQVDDHGDTEPGHQDAQCHVHCPPHHAAVLQRGAGPSGSLLLQLQDSVLKASGPLGQPPPAASGLGP